MGPPLFLWSSQVPVPPPPLLNPSHSFELVIPFPARGYVNHLCDMNYSESWFMWQTSVPAYGLPTIGSLRQSCDTFLGLWEPFLRLRQPSGWNMQESDLCGKELNNTQVVRKAQKLTCEFDQQKWNTLLAPWVLSYKPALACSVKVAMWTMWWGIRVEKVA